MSVWWLEALRRNVLERSRQCPRGLVFPICELRGSIDTFNYGVESTEEFTLSPAHEITNGAPEVRKDLTKRPLDRPWPILEQLAIDGFTDYVAWPIHHTLQRSHMVSFSTKRPGGFLEHEVDLLRDILPVLSLVSEIRVKNVLARTLLDTYVGPHASEQILAGATTRGSGGAVNAAIMITDLRNFTEISDLWPRDDVIEMLNAYFDAISDPIARNGGEILKFLGDGLLAIFPLDKEKAASRLLLSINEARANMKRLNAEQNSKNRPLLNYGVGIHLGEVMYGNIGSSKRLDFTVVGPAVNITSRLEALTKEVGLPVLLSAAFAESAGCGGSIERIGVFPLRGLGDPIEVFALKDADQ